MKEAGRTHKKSGIGNVRAEKWNEGDNREKSGNQRSVRQAKQEEGRSRNILYFPPGNTYVILDCNRFLPDITTAIRQVALRAEIPLTVCTIFVLASQTSNHPSLTQCHTGRESQRYCQIHNQI